MNILILAQPKNSCQVFFKKFFQVIKNELPWAPEGGIERSEALLQRLTIWVRLQDSSETGYLNETGIMDIRHGEADTNDQPQLEQDRDHHED